jgi:hypothetical protein
MALGLAAQSVVANLLLMEEKEPTPEGAGKCMSAREGMCEPRMLVTSKTDRGALRRLTECRLVSMGCGGDSLRHSPRRKTAAIMTARRL